MKKLLLCCLLALFSGQVSAQQDVFRWKLGGSAGLLRYHGDLGSQWPSFSSLKERKDAQDFAYSLSLEASLGKKGGLRFQVGNGRLMASDRLQKDANFMRSFNVQTNIQSANVLIIKYFERTAWGRQALLVPYIGVGAGYVAFDPYADLFLENGARYHYWSDGTIRAGAEGNGSSPTIVPDGIYETDLRKFQTETAYNTGAAQAIGVAGLKIRLSKRFSANIEYSFAYTFTDYLDDVSGSFKASYPSELHAYVANPANWSGKRGSESRFNDRYASAHVGLFYSFGKKDDDQLSKLPSLYYSSGEWLLSDSTAVLPTTETQSAWHTHYYPYFGLVSFNEKEVKFNVQNISLGKEQAITAIPVGEKPLQVTVNQGSIAVNENQLPVGSQQQPVEKIPVSANQMQDNAGKIPANVEVLQQQVTALTAQQEALKAEIAAVKAKNAAAPTYQQSGAYQPNNAGVPSSTHTTVVIPANNNQVLTDSVQAMSLRLQAMERLLMGIPNGTDSTAGKAMTGERAQELLPLYKEMLQLRRELAETNARKAKQDTLVVAVKYPEMPTNTADPSLQLRIAALEKMLEEERQKSALAQQKPTPIVVADLYKQTILYFKINAATITAADQEKIRTTAQYAKQNGLKAVVKGYTDRLGNAQQNAILAQKRALAVKNALISYGMDARAIVIDFAGPDTQIAEPTSTYGRRVEIWLE